MSIVIDYEKILSKNIDSLKECVRHPIGNMILQEGQHYKLLAYLSEQFENKVLFDIGSHVGSSSLSLATSPSNKVISYDIVKFPTAMTKFKGTDNVIKVPNNNITYKIGNAIQDPLLLESALIFLDTRHAGKFEWEVYQHLHANGYKGILVLDDIHYCSQMKKFWNMITNYPKHDITEIGHHVPLTGTGIVNFSGKPITFKKCDLECTSKFPQDMETYMYDKNYINGKWA
jgi:hypothetical protein